MAISLLNELRQRGVNAFVRDGRLICAPLSQMSSSLRGRVQQHRESLIALLAAQTPAECPKRAHEAASKTSETQSDESSGGFGGGVQAAFRDIAPASPQLSAESNRPRRQCYLCGGATFWSPRGGAVWVCNRCHRTDQLPDEVEWHVVADARYITGVTRPAVGCPACKFSGFEFSAGGRWTVCRCNDGFDRHVPSDAAEGNA